MVAHSPAHPTFDHLWFRFTQGIDEVINARVWEGIHFRNSDEQGMHAGRCVGQFVVRHALRRRFRATGNERNNDSDDDHQADPGKPNLYSTEEHRHLVPATLLPAFPAGTFMAWAYQGLKVTAPAATLAGGSVVAVRLAVAGLTTYSAPLMPQERPKLSQARWWSSSLSLFLSLPVARVCRRNA